VPPPIEPIQQIERALGMEGERVMRYSDWPQGQLRTVQVLTDDAGRRTLSAFMLAGDTRAEAWLKPLLQEHAVVDAFGLNLLAPGAEPPVAMASKGKQVCTCFNVCEPDIVTALQRCEGNDHVRLAKVQADLKCGTNCGSCLPTLRKLARDNASVAQTETS
jgi:assimilatory nitrate reductase catalytic subunit